MGWHIIWKVWRHPLPFLPWPPGRPPSRPQPTPPSGPSWAPPGRPWWDTPATHSLHWSSVSRRSSSPTFGLQLLYEDFVLLVVGGGVIHPDLAALHPGQQSVRPTEHLLDVRRLGESCYKHFSSNQPIDLISRKIELIKGSFLIFQVILIIYRLLWRLTLLQLLWGSGSPREMVDKHFHSEINIFSDLKPEYFLEILWKLKHFIFYF